MLRRTEEFNRSILDKSACGMVSYRLPNHDNMYLNAAALRVFGARDIAEAETEVPRALKAAVFNDPTVVKKLIELQTQDGSVDFECQITNSKGRTSNLLLHSETVMNPLGDRIAYTTFLDISENKQLQAINDRLSKQNHVINGLASEYSSVWLIEDEGKFVGRYKDTNANIFVKEIISFVEQEPSYAEGMEYYKRVCVHEDDWAEFDKKTRYETVLAEIRKKPVYNVVYRRHYQGKMEYFQISYALVDKNSDSSNFVMGFKNINDLVQADHKRSEELAAALAAAEQANIAKTQFLNSMSHDIRTPMNAIIGFTHLLSENLADIKKSREYIGKIRSSSNLLLMIINQVLEMARIESGKTVLNKQAVNLREVVQSLNTVFEPEIKEKSLRYHSLVDIRQELVLCDRTKLGEIVLNIVSNAIKYTEAGGSICLTLKEQADAGANKAAYELTVEDTGIGMDEAYLPHIFEEFSREHTTTETKIAGTGLGLPIVKALVELMGGTIAVQSKVGVGTVFTVKLAFELAEENAPAAGAEPQQTLTAEQLKGRSILLAEDNALNAEIATVILTQAGFVVKHVEDGAKCVAELRAMPIGTYDVVLMDVQMPNMDGYAATKAIRELQDARAKIPVIAMTANVYDEDKQRAFASGMTGFIAKPLNIKTMLQVLSEQLNEK